MGPAVLIVDQEAAGNPKGDAGPPVIEIERIGERQDEHGNNGPVFVLRPELKEIFTGNCRPVIPSVINS